MKAFGVRAFLVCACWISLQSASTCAGVTLEENFWPIVVHRAHTDDDPTRRTEFLGPLGSKIVTPGETRMAIRPVLGSIEQHESPHQFRSYFLYPIFHTRYYPEEDVTFWNFFNLAKGERIADGTGSLDLFPFYLARDSGEEEGSYKGIFPLYGEVKNRFFHDRITWRLWPLYTRLERDGVVTTATPWPFIQRTSGENAGGLEIWPLGGDTWKEGVFERRYALWPLLYDYREKLDTDRPRRQLGILPFYARTTKPDLISETWIYPFFGYTRQTGEEEQYYERRWLWPLFVTGEGNLREEVRFLPFYRRVSYEDYEKRIVMWPVWRKEKYLDGRLEVTKRKVLLFIYNQTDQRAANPKIDFHARRASLWPLYTYWNNGQGRKQFQLFSPIEPIYSDNDGMRLIYSPLFSIYRYSNESGNIRHSALWDFITLEKIESYKTINVGPLLNLEAGPDRRQVELLKGLLTLERNRGEGDIGLFWGHLTF